MTVSLSASLGPIPDIVAPSCPKREKTYAPVQRVDLETCEHLYLKECKKFFCQFLNQLAHQSNETETKRSIRSIKHRVLTQVSKRIYGPVAKERRWSLKEETKEQAQKQWSTKEEEKRQKKTLELMKEGMYEALAKFKEPQQVHYRTCLEIAKKKKQQISHRGKIDIAFGFSIPTPSSTKPMEVEIRTRQYGKEILSSIEKRNKNVPVNLQKERVTFVTDSGRTLSAIQLRSGSFDFPDIESKDPDIKIPTTPLDPKIKGQIEYRLSSFIAEHLLHKTSQEYIHLLSILMQYKEAITGKKQKAVENAIVLLQAELKMRWREEKIIEANADCIHKLFCKVDKDSKRGKKLGVQLPGAVQEAFAKDPILSKQRWAMMSFQTPINIIAGKGWINRTILYLSTARFLPRSIQYLFLKLADKSLSELEPIYRCMKGYKLAAKKAQDIVADALYFNLPTNFIGSKVNLRIGALRYSKQINEIFIHGKEDTHRMNAIKKATEKSTAKVYELAHHAMKVLEQAEENESSKEKKEELKRHYRTIKCLTDQTFEVYRGKLELRMAPGKKAQYEVIARLNVLMQMMSFTTTGHCRSGNNRTAAWVAKSHQILGAIAASSDGTIDSSHLTAGRLAHSPQDHWSLPLYLQCYRNSLVLQQANKGTKGTKIKMPEVENKALQRALFSGAFDLADHFDKEAYQKAKENASRKKTQRNRYFSMSKRA